MRNSPKTTKTISDAEWSAACEFHVGHILAQAEAGYSDAAGRHAEALVHMAVTRRALEIMSILDLGWFSKAMAIAKHEMFDVMVDLSRPKGSGFDCAHGKQPMAMRVERSAA